MLENDFYQDDFDTDFEDLLEDEENEEAEPVSASFPVITKRKEDFPHEAFNDPDYYKIALGGEGDISQRLHGILQKYIKSKDPKDKSVFRMQFIPAYWDFLVNIARKAPGRLPAPKKYMLRFGILHPNFLSEDHRNLFASIIEDNLYEQPIYYLDEWFKGIGTGHIRNSATDEVKTSRRSNNVKYMQLMEKAQGKFDGAKSLVKAREQEKKLLEGNLLKFVEQIAGSMAFSDLPDVSACYTDSQRRAFSEIQETMKNLIRIDRDQGLLLRDLKQAEDDLSSIRQRISEEGEAVEIDTAAVDTEFETIRQMAKMTIGRQGNHFPLLTSEFFRSRPIDTGTRENVISIMAWIESIDPEAFCRVYRNNTNRIVPYVILIPSYGDVGMCWEPYDRYNRASSRGRIAVPMYPKDLQIAVLTAVADLRWQVAKEKASHYWMEEGITGHYFQWFQKRKYRGDLKDFFIRDYIIWITKESEGTQKLDRELRGTFWRYLPFAQQIKEKLKTRNMVYQELYQRDLNRTLSDGY